jgi:hypothetical protein
MVVWRVMQATARLHPAPCTLLQPAPSMSHHPLQLSSCHITLSSSARPVAPPALKLVGVLR